MMISSPSLILIDTSPRSKMKSSLEDDASAVGGERRLSNDEVLSLVEIVSRQYSTRRSTIRSWLRACWLLLKKNVRVGVEVSPTMSGAWRILGRKRMLTERTRLICQTNRFSSNRHVLCWGQRVNETVSCKLSISYPGQGAIDLGSISSTAMLQ